MKRIRQIVNDLISKKAVSGMDETDRDADKGIVDALTSGGVTVTAEKDSSEQGGAQGVFGSLSALDRKTFDGIVSESLSRGRTTGCLLVCDVDRCKEINDIYGSDIGDAVLRSVETVLRSVFGDSTCIGSPGGDAFMLWLPILSERNADDVRRQVGIVNDRLLHPVRELPPVSISAGAAFCRIDDDCKGIYSRANKMLYRVKGSGRCGCEMSL